MIHLVYGDLLNSEKTSNTPKVLEGMDLKSTLWSKSLGIFGYFLRIKNR
jgi:hypothetical protein